MGERLKIKTTHIPDENGFDPDNVLKEAMEERERLLEKSPDLRGFQEEIDRRLRNSGSVENRMAVLGIMNEARVEKGLNKLTSLLGLLKKMRDFFSQGK